MDARAQQQKRPYRNDSYVAVRKIMLALLVGDGTPARTINMNGLHKMHPRDSWDALEAILQAVADMPGATWRGAVVVRHGQVLYNSSYYVAVHNLRVDVLQVVPGHHHVLTWDNGRLRLDMYTSTGLALSVTNKVDSSILVMGQVDAEQAAKISQTFTGTVVYGVVHHYLESKYHATNPPRAMSAVYKWWRSRWD